MKPSTDPILCDGCSLAASPEHIAARVRRLELGTRFRPIHIGTLFVSLAPPAAMDEGFYNAEIGSDDSDPLLTAVGILAPAVNPDHPYSNSEIAASRLNEFQHRGHYLTYLFECGIDAISIGKEEFAALLERQASTLIRRIRFNYRPKQIALLGIATAPLIPILRDAGLGDLLVLDHCMPWCVPESRDLPSVTAFRAALSTSKPGSSSVAVV